jgi:TRAP-type C4-dicarboxylate transport system permease small subunit
MMANAVRGISDAAGRVTEGLLFLVTGTVVLLIGAQVLFRYVLNHSIFWAEEVGRILLVWITFLGASAAFKRKAHMGVDFFVQRLPPSTRKLCRCCVLLAASSFFAVLIVHGWLYCAFLSTQKTPALGIPMPIPFAVLPVSGLLFLLHACDQLIDEWTSGKT